jgi:hypothetical protein
LSKELKIISVGGRERASECWAGDLVEIRLS